MLPRICNRFSKVFLLITWHYLSMVKFIPALIPKYNNAINIPRIKITILTLILDPIKISSWITYTNITIYVTCVHSKTKLYIFTLALGDQLNIIIGCLNHAIYRLRCSISASKLGWPIQIGSTIHPSNKCCL